MNALEDSSVINENILSDTDESKFTERYNLCSSIAKQLGDFYDPSTYDPSTSDSSKYNTPYSFS
mgnify:FL=1